MLFQLILRVTLVLDASSALPLVRAQKVGSRREKALPIRRSKLLDGGDHLLAGNRGYCRIPLHLECRIIIGVRVV
jgi:hypothetical protein